MSQERLTLRKINEILRLKYEAGLSNRAIAGACKISNGTVGLYLQRAEAAGLGAAAAAEVTAAMGVAKANAVAPVATMVANLRMGNPFLFG